MRVLPRVDEENAGSALTDRAHIARAAAAVKPPGKATTGRYIRLSSAGSLAANDVCRGAGSGSAVGLAVGAVLVVVHSDMAS